MGSLCKMFAVAVVCFKGRAARCQPCFHRRGICTLAVVPATFKRCRVQKRKRKEKEPEGLECISRVLCSELCFLLICNVITSSWQSKMPITREKMLREQELQRVWRRFSNLVPVRPGTEGRQPSPESSFKPLGNKGPQHHCCLLGQSTFSSPPRNTFFIIIIQADGGFQFSVFTSRPSHSLHSECFWAPDNRKYFENPFFFSRSKQRRFKPLLYITYVVVYGAP